MARLKLIVQPDGRYVLTSEAPLSEKESEVFLSQWERAQKDPHGLAILPDCEVIILEKPDR